MLLCEIVSVGKPRSGWIREGVEHYRKLASRFADIRLTTVREAVGKGLDVKQLKGIEGERLLGRIRDRSYTVALTEDGKMLDSLHLAAMFQRKMHSHSEFQFFIGGAHGLSRRILDYVDLRLSLSRLTFPHELALVIILEQVYRALSIARGTAYHK